MLILVIANPRQPTCPWPLRVQMSDSPASSRRVVTRLGWVELGTLPAGSQCNDHDCSVIVLDGTGATVTTVRVLL